MRMEIDKKYLSFLDAIIACVVLVVLGVCLKSFLPRIYGDILLYPVSKFLIFSAIVYGAIKLRNLDTSYLFPRKRYEGRVWYFFLITISLYLLQRITTDIINLLSTNSIDFIKSKGTGFYGFQSRGIKHLFSLVIIGPIMEEILFRGLILRSFLTRYSVQKSIIFSSLLFAFLHVLSPDKYIFSTFIFSFLIAAFLAWVVLKTKNIKIAMVCHMFWNLSNYFLLPFTFMILAIRTETIADVIVALSTMCIVAFILLSVGVIYLKKDLVKN